MRGMGLQSGMELFMGVTVVLELQTGWFMGVTVVLQFHTIYPGQRTMKPKRPSMELTVGVLSVNMRMELLAMRANRSRGPSRSRGCATDNYRAWIVLLIV